MEKKIKTIETVKFNTFQEVKDSVNRLTEKNLHNIDIDPPSGMYCEQWRVRVTWLESFKDE